jgi:hypothetical protein
MGGQWRGNHGRIFLGVPNSVGGENKERKKEKKKKKVGSCVMLLYSLQLSPA